MLERFSISAILGVQVTHNSHLAMSSPTYKFINKLQGKQILVFGATSGIGFAVTEACVEHGANVIITGSKADKLETTIKRLQTSYGDLQSRVSAHVCDLSNEETLESNIVALLDAATDNGRKKINHISFSAGDVFGIPKISEVEIAQIRRSDVVRYLAPIMIAKHAGTYVAASPDSSFTITGGVNSHKPSPGWSVPAAGGSRNEGLARGLAVDLAPVRVNLVAPGAIDTELLRGRVPPPIRDAWVQKSLVKRLGRPEDTAEAYLYLMKDGFITGTVVHTNGGALLV